MIKKIYLLLMLSILAVSGAHAQRIIDLAIDARWTGPSATTMHPVAPYEPIHFDGKTKHWIRWELKNIGPDTIRATDTIHFKLLFSTGASYIVPQHAIPKDSPLRILPASANSTVGFAVFQPIPNLPMPYIDTILWCDSFWMTPGPANTQITDPVMSNNYDCSQAVGYNMWPVDVKDVPLNEDDFNIYPNPATGKLTIKFEARTTGSATITLRDMMGKTVYSQQMDDIAGMVTHSVDVGHLPPGMYTTELWHNNQTLIRKLTIQ